MASSKGAFAVNVFFRRGGITDVLGSLQVIAAMALPNPSVNPFAPEATMAAIRAESDKRFTLPIMLFTCQIVYVMNTATIIVTARVKDKITIAMSVNSRCDLSILFCTRIRFILLLGDGKCLQPQPHGVVVPAQGRHGRLSFDHVYNNHNEDDKGHHKHAGPEQWTIKQRTDGGR